MGLPCITTRNNTERPSTVIMGTNVLVGLKKDKLLHEAFSILDGKHKSGNIPPLWDGHAAERVARILVEKLK